MIAIAPAASLKSIVVAGMVCIDLIPALPSELTLTPGTLTRTGAMSVGSGGAVSNVSLALHRLGWPARVAGFVGDDALGTLLAATFDAAAPGLSDGLLVRPGEATGYTVVISVPGRDRAFWHCPGVNDTFDPVAVPDAAFADAAWLHFGYPPVMRHVCEHPAALAEMLRRARAAGCRTSLDLCSIDPASVAGRVDWPGWLQQVLPQVDIFTPSFDELSVALHRRVIDLRCASANAMARDCCAMGAGATMLKLGDRGIYYLDRTNEKHVPCFSVEVATTNGSGDSTIAGLIAGLSSGASVEDALELAVAVGAASCEKPDASSGVPSAAGLANRIAAGWPRLDVALPD